VEDEAIAWGADAVVRFENENFSTPTPHLFAGVMASAYSSQIAPAGVVPPHRFRP
jgi:hypothetical protein